MQRYRIFDQDVTSDDPGFADLLERAHDQRARPHCLCRDDADLPLYISARQGGLVLARWPGTGLLHAPGCDHYEAPDLLTGKGQVLGSAIVEDEDSGEVTLKFGFPLARGAARAAPSALTNDKPAITSRGQRLSMRGLLHFLWDRGELSHWHPKMAGKRNWYIVRRAILNAALPCKTRGDSLARRLFVPETFQSTHKDDILGRRRSELAPAYASRDAIMIVVGEITAIKPARYGEAMALKHLADWPFMMDEDMARRFHRRFAVEEQLWQAEGAAGHLVMAASFAVNAAGLPQLFEVSVLPMTPQWMPYETLDERALIEKAVAEDRRFVKGLRFNLDLDKPIASLTLVDTGPQATAVYLARNLPDPSYDEAMAVLHQTAGVRHVVWRPGDKLPPRGGPLRLAAPAAAVAPVPIGA